LKQHHSNTVYHRQPNHRSIHLVGYNSVADSTGLSPFVWPLLPSKCTKSHEIAREFELIAVQGHPRSSTLVSMESPYVTSLLVSNSNFTRICYRFRDIYGWR